MKCFYHVTTLTLFSLAIVSSAQAKEFTKTGPKGGSAQGSTTQTGNTVKGSSSFSGAHGASGNAQGSATYDVRSQTVSGSGTTSTTGPRGNSVTSQGSGTYDTNTGTYTGQGQVTGPKGQTHGGSVTGGNGSATVTGNNGKTKTISDPR